MSETESAAPDNSIAWLEKTALENAQRTKSGAAKTGALRLLAELKGVLKPTNTKPVADTKPAEELSAVEAAREIAFLLARGVKLQGFPDTSATASEHKELPKPEPTPTKTIEEIRIEVEASLKEQDGLDQWERIELERCKARELKRPDQRQTFANVGYSNAKPRRAKQCLNLLAVGLELHAVIPVRATLDQRGPLAARAFPGRQSASVPERAR